MSNNQSNNGTWRESKKTLPPKQAETIYFGDTKPNHILINNPSASPIYIGTNGTISSTHYDMIIPPFASKLYAKMMHTTRLEMFYDGVEPINIQVTSWEAEFNPASVSQSVELVGGGADGLLGVVLVSGILDPLPSGNNLLGGVFISEFAAALPTGNNKIGRVEVESGTMKVTELPQDGANYKQVIAAGVEDVVVKTGKGFVYQVVSDKPVQLIDGTTPAWKQGDFKSDTPLICNTSIKLRFTEAGTAFILFK